jgi:uncharacterized Zn finger protein (UPF0148 family)
VSKPVPWDSFLWYAAREGESKREQKFSRDWLLAPANVTASFRDGSVYCRLCGSYFNGQPSEHVVLHEPELDAWLARRHERVERTRSTLDDDHVEHVRGLRAQGMSQRAIAQTLGISRRQALGGAVIGGFITSGSNLLIESTRRRHRHEDEDKRAEHEQRRAVRIVLAELEEIDYSIRGIVRSGVWGPAEKQLPTTAWAEHHETLADLDDAIWSSVHSAYRNLNELNWSLRWRQQLRQVRTPELNEIEKARFRQAWLFVRGAQQALGPLDVGEQKAAGRVAAHQQVTAKVDRDIWPEAHTSAAPEQPS